MFDSSKQLERARFGIEVYVGQSVDGKIKASKTEYIFFDSRTTGQDNRQEWKILDQQKRKQ